MKIYLLNILVALSQLINALAGGNPDELLSASAYRTKNAVLMGLINFLFWDKAHCLKAFEFERNNPQMPFTEYICSLNKDS